MLVNRVKKKNCFVFEKHRAIFDVIEFCKKAFGARERMRISGPGGKIMHAEILIGDSIIMLNDAMQEPPQPAGLFLYVPDVDKVFAKALTPKEMKKRAAAAFSAGT